MKPVKLYPGTPDISDQFSSTNIDKALDEYKPIKHGHGDYKFGDLTIKCFNLTGKEKAWEDDVRHYPRMFSTRSNGTSLML